MARNKTWDRNEVSYWVPKPPNIKLRVCRAQLEIPRERF